MARFRLRFRKTFPIIPGIFFITINKKSISWNFRFGPYSRTWGKNHTISTLDAPGTFGASWRKTSKKGDDKSFSLFLSIAFAFFGIIALGATSFIFSWSWLIYGIASIVGIISIWFFGFRTFFATPFITGILMLLLNWIF